MERIIPENARQRLASRAPLPVDPARSIAVKRDVHSFEIATDAASFAEAFRDVVTDPAGTFGLIRVKRPADRLGRPFEVGERFQGSFSIERAALAWIEAGRARFARRALAALLATRSAAWILARVEDLALSNYAEIVEIAMEADAAAGGARRLVYRYLEGTPIAGSSTFTIEPRGERRCRLTQVFEFQEVNGMALATFERFGLKYHDQVVYMQVHKAAARAGARVVAGTIPEEYGRLSGVAAPEAAPAAPREAAPPRREAAALATGGARVS
jgi:hypothetical protein